MLMGNSDEHTKGHEPPSRHLGVLQLLQLTIFNSVEWRFPPALNVNYCEPLITQVERLEGFVAQEDGDVFGEVDGMKASAFAMEWIRIRLRQRGLSRMEQGGSWGACSSRKLYPSYERHHHQHRCGHHDLTNMQESGAHETPRQVDGKPPKHCTSFQQMFITRKTTGDSRK